MLGDAWLSLSDDKLYDQFDTWFKDICGSEAYSTSFPTGTRIPWRSAKEAADSPQWGNDFQQPGCYLFCAGNSIPRYIGETQGTLKKRLFGRYVAGKHSQCTIAEKYEPILVKGGWKDLPDELLAWYFKGYSSKKWKAMKHQDPGWKTASDKQVADYFRAQGGSTVRLRHAVDFAKHGAGNVWFAIIPISIATNTKKLENNLTRTVEKWNKDREYRSLLRGK